MLRVELIFFILLSKLLSSYSDESYCYSNDIDPYIYTGSKTAYEFIHGDDKDYHIIPHCKPVQFWSLNRHGTRYPGESKIIKLKNLINLRDEILNNFENNEIGVENKRLCNDDVELFRKWTWNDNMQANNLTVQGWHDMAYLAERQMARFPNLLNIPYTKNDFKVRYTVSERTRLSFQAFASQLFRTNNTDFIHTHSIPDDPLLEPYRACNYWQANIVNNSDTYDEYEKLKKQKKYKKLVKNVSKRLGFETKLKKNIIKYMYDMCRYEKAWNLIPPSTWCAAFTKKQLKILEYATDLHDYYETGYGSEINTKMACTLVKNMIIHFRNVINGDLNEPKAILYFTHSETLRLLYTTMGMYEDKKPLKSDNMDEHKNRLWRTSLQSSFATNLDVILYNCEGDQYRVLLFLNEKPATYRGCAGGICSWDTFKEKLERFADECSMDFCDDTEAN